MWENKLVKGIHISRYIMSYVRMGGSISKRAGASDFEDWLKSLTALELTEEDIDAIMHIAMNGKLELEINAKEFLKRKESEL